MSSFEGHSPKPWAVIEVHQGFAVKEPRGHSVAWCAESTIAGQRSSFLARPEAEANARLIAAAPELEEFRAWVEQAAARVVLDEQQAGDFARAAMHKARALMGREADHE